MNIFVSNISFKTDERDLRDAFAEFGQVNSCRIIMDRDTGRSRGFGFVEMPDEHARDAIKHLDGAPLDGRDLSVREAEPRGGNRAGGYRRGEDERGRQSRARERNRRESYSRDVEW